MVDLGGHARGWPGLVAAAGAVLRVRKSATPRTRSTWRSKGRMARRLSSWSTRGETSWTVRPRVRSSQLAAACGQNVLNPVRAGGRRSGQRHSPRTRGDRSWPVRRIADRRSRVRSPHMPARPGLAQRRDRRRMPVLGHHRASTRAVPRALPRATAAQSAMRDGFPACPSRRPGSGPCPRRRHRRRAAPDRTP
jgi:hypothetical protein